MTKLNKFFKDESGATIIEYGLLAALLSVAAVTVLPLIGGNLVTKFTAVNTGLATTVGA